MKKLKYILSYCVMIVMFVFIFCGINIINVSASERFNIGNGYFEYEIKDNNEITITNYFGTDTELKIPSEIDGKSVTSIGNEAFSDYIGYTSIVIPNSVANIGRGALKGLGSSLTNINVDKENEYFSSEDGILFNKDKSELICYPCKKKDESYTIPDSVISIGEFSFYGCNSLKSVIIPNSVVSIGESSFCKCTSLKSIKIPDSVTNIKSYVFSSCISLTSITIPDSITSIERNAFLNCHFLRNIKIPNSVTSIESWAFSGCDDLVIYGYKDSYAETYANEELIQFKDINNQTLNIENPKINDNTSSQEIETTKTNNSNISIIVILLISIGIIILLWILLIVVKRENK